MDVTNCPSLKTGCAILVVIMAVVWTEIFIFSKDDDTRMKFLKFQFVLILEFILSCFSYVVLKFSQSIPAFHRLRNRPLPLRILRYFYLSVFVILCVLAQISWLSALLPLSPEPLVIIYIAWCAFGIIAQYLFISLIMTFLHFIIRNGLEKLVRRGFSDEVFGTINFQNFRAGISFIYTFIMAILCIHGGLQLPTVKPVNISLGSKLPDSLSGLVIAQLSDIHLGPTSGLSRLRSIVEMTNEFAPDVVVVNGDLMDGRVQHLGDAVQQLENLRPKKGIYFVTGNHEYISGGVDDLFLFLKNHGVTPLHNSHVKISGDNSEDFLYLVGTDDIEADKFRYKGHGFKLDSAVNATDEDHIRILLAHQPKAASKALNSPFHFDLILSGHTHGGQFFPYNGLIWLGNPFFRGLYEGQGPNGNSQVYVTEGSVFWGSPFRFGSTMEITKIVLQK